MYRITQSFLIVAATIISLTATDAALACSHARRVVYYAPPRAARVVRTVHVLAPAQPTTVVHVTHRPVRYTTTRPSLPELEVNATVTASANFLGIDPGFVLIRLGAATLPCEIVDWNPTAVTFKSPNLGLRDSTRAELQLIRPDGRIARTFQVRMVPRPSLVVQSTAGGLRVEPNSPSVETAHTPNAGGLQLHTVEKAPAPSSDIALTVGG